jgi:hypothetical protein
MAEDGQGRQHPGGLKLFPAPRKRGRMQYDPVLARALRARAISNNDVDGRHCERSEAIQCSGDVLDCFVAELVIGPATSGRTRWLLAMTKEIREMERRQTQGNTTRTHTARGTRHGEGGLRRPSAYGRARLPAFHLGSRHGDLRHPRRNPGHASWDAVCTGVTRLRLSQSSEHLTRRS